MISLLFNEPPKLPEGRGDGVSGGVEGCRFGGSRVREAGIGVETEGVLVFWTELRGERLPETVIQEHEEACSRISLSIEGSGVDAKDWKEALQGVSDGLLQVGNG